MGRSKNVSPIYYNINFYKNQVRARGNAAYDALTWIRSAAGGLRVSGILAYGTQGHFFPQKFRIWVPEAGFGASPASTRL